MVTDRRLVIPLAVAMAVGGCASRQPPETVPPAAPIPAAATAPRPEIDALLQVVDAERAVRIYVRGQLQAVPGGESASVQLWLARSGAMRLQLGDGTVTVSDGATLWTLSDGRTAAAPAGREPHARSLAGLISPFDLVEVLLPAPFAAVGQATLLLERDSEQVRLLRVCEDCEPLRPLRAVTLSGDGSRVLRRQVYAEAGERLRVDWLAPHVVQWTRVGAVTVGLRLEIEESERDPVFPEGTFSSRCADPGSATARFRCAAR